MSFTCYPAIDVRGGRVVRLRQGDYARETRYDEDPFARAMAFADAGARWLHLVDLDAARIGGYTLLPLLARIVADGRLQVQTGGGVRTRQDVARMRDAGAARVVVGSLAVEEPACVGEWLAEFGADAITIALDVRLDDQGRWRPAVRGWTADAAQGLDACVDDFIARGLRHLLCTDIARDGMLSGPNTALYAELRARAPGVALQASGGVRDLADLRAARAAGCAGAVLGRALLEGRLDLAQALAC
ncbi:MULTISPECIES: 1-(5-phosphoribosyl)-5-[(5-phosphoribosylamino)methylideneamino]imidazole-4-carboxamide isomerase [Lysobacteraceae]|uniref:1-(5-phosphoribosyl)-5-[(5- phosphoribosylamino)methylideneamino]imidazole-4- carboxamide isomerase n=1 Tax=Lysobacteraceae TaxID=32033 RepID=UPI001BCD9A3E|nr:MULTISPECIES: HisA/HisF-related TIM barrel protein [Lysobacter]